MACRARSRRRCIPECPYTRFRLPQPEVIPNRAELNVKKKIKTSEKPVVIRWWSRDYLIMPPKYLFDLRAAGWTQLHFFRNISDALFLYKTVDDLYTSPVAERMVNVVKKGLNPRLPYLTPGLMEEIEYGFEQELKNGKETSRGTEVPAMRFFSNIVHRSATRLMIGPELCRNEKFLEETTALLESIFFTAIVIVNLPLGPFRNALIGLFTLPHKWRLQRCVKMLQPVVEARLSVRNLETSQTSKHTVGDAIDWTLDLVNDETPYNTPKRLAYELLHNLWAASSAPGGMMTEVVYQLLAYPEYVDLMRKEAEVAVKEHGWTEKMLANLHLQDSFIREVNRLLPTGAITCSRTVTTAPFTFSDGLTLPVGTRFGFPIKAMQSDPDLIPAPESFNPFRFAQSSSSETHLAEESRRWSSTSMSTTNLAWGYGNHMCPGRFFAVRELKFILTKMLIEYEIGWDREKRDGRPKPITVEGQFVPNMKQKVFLRRRDVY
ncbi:unnamed protein product [Periconia digitata]|uniref:Cytochrome P450 n=1 Tax=Periconia digitata TaxID=1303443 RepID=A0A9W4XN05_9PLEO|nr:unnamed protein product [Periconia digitata]